MYLCGGTVMKLCLVCKEKLVKFSVRENSEGGNMQRIEQMIRDLEHNRARYFKEKFNIDFYYISVLDGEKKKA